MSAESKPVSSYLSKSLFIRGCQCHKSLWLKKRRPELLEEISPEQESRFAAGYAVGALAKELFPAGVEVPYDGLSHDEQVAMTARLIADGVGTIYEATFCHDSIFIKADILHRGIDGWELYEVKASTDVKEYHVRDAALQLWVVRGAGIYPARVAIVHINNGYVRQGDLDLQQLFTIADISAEAESLQTFVAGEIVIQRNMLRGEEPDITIGPQCSSPFECDFSGHCWQHIPEDSVFDLVGRGTLRFALYRQGIVRQADIPLDMLTDLQRMQVESTLSQRDSISLEGVQEFLGLLWHPLCFIDFETFMDPIPPYDGTRPYQQIPFQYSLHIQHEPRGEIQHHGYLAKPGKDHRAELTEQLLATIPPQACLLAWNQSFEIGVLNGLAEVISAEKAMIMPLVENFRDLMDPFRSRTFYLWQMKGRWSLKVVLPLLAPELSYEGMEIADGGAAMNAWHVMKQIEDPAEMAKLRGALWEYCKLDTLAMVRILEKMQEL